MAELLGAEMIYIRAKHREHTGGPGSELNVYSGVFDLELIKLVPAGLMMIV